MGPLIPSHWTELTPVHLFVIISAVVAGGVALSYYMRYRRRSALAALAASAGLPFSADGQDFLSLEGTGVELLRTGHSRDAANMTRLGVPAGELRVFDYSYVTGSGKNRNSHDFTVALFECSTLQAPQFDLRPETLLYKLGEMAGFKDIDLPAFPVFSEKYRLTGPDEAAVHMFFTPERAAWFERNQGLYVQASGKFVLLFKKEGLLPVSAWQGFIEEARIFAAEVLK